MIIDLHSHLLPGVDDGAQTVEDSLALARQAVQEGVTHTVLTPHHRNGRYNNYAKHVLDCVEKLQSIYEEHDIPLRIYGGQEIHLTEHFFDDLYNGHLLSLDGQGRYYLVEFPSRRIPDFAEGYFWEMLEQGITPVIAHPERNGIIMADYSVMERFVQMGCLGQLTAVSMSGAIGQKYQRIGADLLKRGLVHLMASDAHSVKWRPMNVQKGFSWIEKEFGAEVVRGLKDNARAIFNSDPVKGWKSR